MGGLRFLLRFLFAFCILGIEAIGREIENPFGTDYNDLPIECFQKELKAEIRALTSCPFPKVTDWKLNGSQKWKV